MWRRAVLLACVLASACGVAPVRWDGAPDPPPQWTYVGAHGRPLAYGGGVCTVPTPHAHRYPPTPRDAFDITSAGAFDKRALLPFIGRHPHHGRTCHIEGWHLHTEPPDAGLVFDDRENAWRAAPDGLSSPATTPTASPPAG